MALAPLTMSVYWPSCVGIVNHARSGAAVSGPTTESALYIASMTPEKALIAAKELQLEQSTAVPVVFHGHSMWPFFRDGDSLMISPALFEDVRVGDIVTVRKDDKFPTYRVVAKSARWLTLQGDNWPDAMVQAPPADVLGKAVARERAGRRLASHSWTWRVVAFLRTTAVARRYRRPITRIIRKLLGFARETSNA